MDKEIRDSIEALAMPQALFTQRCDMEEVCGLEPATIEALYTINREPLEALVVSYLEALKYSESISIITPYTRVEPYIVLMDAEEVVGSLNSREIENKQAVIDAVMACLERYNEAVGWLDEQLTTATRKWLVEHKKAYLLAPYNLPKKLDTERAREAFNRAIGKGIIVPNGDTMQFIGGDALLAKFTWIIYDGMHYPATALQKIFGRRNLKQTLNQVLNSRNPRGWDEIEPITINLPDNENN